MGARNLISSNVGADDIPNINKPWTRGGDQKAGSGLKNPSLGQKHG